MKIRRRFSKGHKENNINIEMPNDYGALQSRQIPIPAEVSGWRLCKIPRRDLKTIL